MDDDLLHPWSMPIPEARALQRRLSERLILTGEPQRVRRVAGLDVAFDMKRNLAVGALVLLDYPSLKVLARIRAALPCLFPYIPGLLSFREGPVLMELWRRLPERPDLLLFDGQGVAHPRGLGIASHIGLRVDLPSIGVAKSILCGEPEGECNTEAGATADLRAADGRVIGRLLRNRTGVKPLVISAGHRIGLEEAVAWTRRLSTRYRLPEPTRLADRLSKEPWKGEE